MLTVKLAAPPAPAPMREAPSFPERKAVIRELKEIVRLLEKRGQARDHPVVLSVPETGYLKCLVLLVSY